MDDIMNGVHCVPMMAAESNTEVYRQQTQNTQKLSRFSIGIATFMHFRGHSIGASFPVLLGSRRSRPITLNQSESK
jgi:hypothetical protein